MYLPFELVLEICIKSYPNNNLKFVSKAIFSLIINIENSYIKPWLTTNVPFPFKALRFTNHNSHF